MELKIMHTGDIHIGMKFKKYPELVRKGLIEARFQVIQNMIEKANLEQCNLFVIAGDLFDKINIPKRDILKVIDILKGFAGDCLVVMPGNHDYDNGMVELWERFEENMGDNMLLVNEMRPYRLNDFNLDLTIYPAVCQSKHSEKNNLGWIRELEMEDDDNLKLGLAHGALAGLSPDPDQKYYNMSTTELEEMGLDLWLLGHTHVPYPAKKEVTGRRIYNAGTPEPDGMDCGHPGQAWLIRVHNNKIEANQIETGKYRFYDQEYTVKNQEDFAKIKDEFLEDNPEEKLVRLHLAGRVDEQLFAEKEDFYKQFRDKLAYFVPEDGGLKVRITSDTIEDEFTTGSFPQRLLGELAKEEEDEGALQLAYELIREVQK